MGRPPWGDQGAQGRRPCYIGRGSALQPLDLRASVPTKNPRVPNDSSKTRHCGATAGGHCGRAWEPLRADEEGCGQRGRCAVALNILLS